MARWDKLWRDDAYVARNWLDPDSDIVRLSPVMKERGVQRVLDLGCGPGRHVLYLSRQGFEMHGLDISAAGVERCRKAVEQQHGGPAGRLKAGLQNMHTEAVDVRDHAGADARRQGAIAIGR